MDTKLGRIHNGDCVAGMNALPQGSIDLVFADPPFNIGYKYDVYEDKKPVDEYLAWSNEWMRPSIVHSNRTGLFGWPSATTSRPNSKSRLEKSASTVVAG